MLIVIVAAFALLAATLVILLVKARKLRWSWPLAGLLMVAAILFAVYDKAKRGESDRLNKSLSDSCQYLNLQIHSLAWDFQTEVVAKQKGVHSPVDVLRVRDQYSVLVNEHREWLLACIPNASHCLPAALSEGNVDEIEHATSGGGAPTRCR